MPRTQRPRTRVKQSAKRHVSFGTPSCTRHAPLHMALPERRKSERQESEPGRSEVGGIGLRNSETAKPVAHDPEIDHVRVRPSTSTFQQRYD